MDIPDDPDDSLPTSPVLYPAPEPAEPADHQDIWIPYGYTISQDRLAWNIGSRSTSPHLIAVGPSGSGLSTLLRTLTVGATLRGAEVWAVDPTGAVLSDLETWPGVTKVASTPTEARELIDAAHGRMHDIYKLIRSREIHPNDVDHLVILIDLASMLAAQLRHAFPATVIVDERDGDRWHILHQHPRAAQCLTALDMRPLDQGKAAEEHTIRRTFAELTAAAPRRWGYLLGPAVLMSTKRWRAEYVTPILAARAGGQVTCPTVHSSPQHTPAGRAVARRWRRSPDPFWYGEPLSADTEPGEGQQLVDEYHGIRWTIGNITESPAGRVAQLEPADNPHGTLGPRTVDVECLPSSDPVNRRWSRVPAGQVGWSSSAWHRMVVLPTHAARQAQHDSGLTPTQ